MMLDCKFFEDRTMSVCRYYNIHPSDDLHEVSDKYVERENEVGGRVLRSVAGCFSSKIVK